MSKSIYLINPPSDFPSYYEAEVVAAFLKRRAMSNADLATATVAALVPQDWSVQLCEGHVTPIDWDSDADFIGITGKVTQWSQMRLTAERFRARGKTVILGGPFASLAPEIVRPYCDILVRGEIEEIAGQLFSDLAQRVWQQEYSGTRPNLALSPLPRWDLYPMSRTLAGTVQTSRGCPFECEFCDVIQYLGRKQRHKPVAQVLAELDALYRLGMREIFLSDDNFTVYRQRAKELLAALREWNAQREQGHVTFFTQVSIDVAEDDELLQLCADAGLKGLFIGIETPNAASHREMKKRQNLRGDLRERVATIVAHGIAVDGGMIVGFDADGLDIFERQFDFAMSLPVPIFSLGILNAPLATPLHARLQREGRLSEQVYSVASPFSTNIIPRQMTSEELMAGVRWLARQLYHPAAFGERLLRFIDLCPTDGFAPRGRPRRLDLDTAQVVNRLKHLGLEEEKLWHTVSSALERKPALWGQVLYILFRYMQIRYMYDQAQLWEPPVDKAALYAPGTAE